MGFSSHRIENHYVNLGNCFSKFSDFVTPDVLNCK